MKNTVKRLHDQFRPHNYKLVLEPDAVTKKFSGRVSIDGIKVGPLSKRIVFHQVGLKIKSAKLVYFDKKEEKEVTVSRVNNYDKGDEVRIHCAETLKSGRYSVELTFSGKITDTMDGIYPCSYKDGKISKQIIATQFESHYARAVFPCIDEPGSKATFELTLMIPKGNAAISNSKIATKTIAKDKQIITFEPTPKMSTYLLAFVYGELAFKESATTDGIKVRAYATKNNVEHLDFALDIAVKCLDFYNEYFGIKYPLEKCDLIALPDFAAGAMENWGCVTFREQALLVDAKNSSLATKQYVALVIAHELAHQWFGNLVTMRWWTDLWLNEGFASWMEYFTIDHIFPEWQMWVQFAIDEQLQAFALDSLENTHAVEVTVNHPDEIRTIFDAISYSKGASIINMLHKFVGDRDFKFGIRYYLEKHAYNNTDTIDLWKAIEEVSKKPVKEFMHKWSSLPGYPIIQADVEKGQVILAQERFFINPKHRTEDKTIWPVALLANSEALDDLLSAKHKIYDAETVNLKLNEGQTGFYRIVYNASHRERLGELIKRGKVKPLDRLGLLSDIFEASKAGKFDTVEALHFLNCFSGEDNYTVWGVIASALVSIKLVMNDEDLREAIKPYTRKLIKAELTRLGIKKKKTDSHFDRLLRPLIIAMAAGADDAKIVKYCIDTFDSLVSLNDPKSLAKLDPDLRSIIFITAARLGGQEEFNKMLKLHNETSMSELRNSLLEGLTGFRQPEIIKQALDLISSDVVRPQDIAYWIADSFVNRFARKQTWEWLKTHWNWLEKTLGTDLSFYRMPIYAARVFSEDGLLKEYREFFEPRLSPALDRAYRQGIEIIEYQNAWRNRSLSSIKKFFKDQPQS